MKKKSLLTLALASCMLVPGALSLSACGGAKDKNPEFTQYVNMSTEIMTSYGVDLSGSESSGLNNENAQNGVILASGLSSDEQPFHKQLFDKVNADEDKLEANETIGVVMQDFYKSTFYSTLACGKVLTDTFGWTSFYNVVARVMVDEAPLGDGYYVVNKLDEYNYRFILFSDMEKEGETSGAPELATICNIHYVDKGDFYFECRSYSLYGKGFSYVYGNSDLEFAYCQYSEYGEAGQENYNEEYKTVVYNGASAYESLDKSVALYGKDTIFTQECINEIVDQCYALKGQEKQTMTSLQFQEGIQYYVDTLSNGASTSVGSFFVIRDGVLSDFNYVYEDGKTDYTYGKSTMILPRAVKAIRVDLVFPADVEKVIIPNTVEYFDNQRARGEFNPFCFARKMSNGEVEYKVEAVYADNSTLCKVQNENIYYKDKEGRFLVGQLNNLSAFYADNGITSLGQIEIDARENPNIYSLLEENIIQTLKAHNCYSEYVINQIIHGAASHSLYNLMDITIDFYYQPCYLDWLYLGTPEFPITINSLTLKNLPGGSHIQVPIGEGEIDAETGDVPVKEIKNITVENAEEGAVLSILANSKEQSANGEKATKIGKINLCEGLASFIVEGATETDETSLVVPESVIDFNYQPQCSGDFELTINYIQWSGGEMLVPKVSKNHTLTINSRKDRVAKNYFLEEVERQKEAGEPYSNPQNGTSWQDCSGEEGMLYSPTTVQQWQDIFNGQYPNIKINLLNKLPFMLKFDDCDDSVFAENEFYIDVSEDFAFNYIHRNKIDHSADEYDLSKDMAFIFDKQIVEFENKLTKEKGKGYVIPLGEGENNITITYYTDEQDKQSFNLTIYRCVSTTVVYHLGVYEPEELTISEISEGEMGADGKIDTVTPFELVKKNGEWCYEASYTEDVSGENIFSVYESLRLIKDRVSRKYYNLTTNVYLDRSCETLCEPKVALTSEELNVYLKWEEWRISYKVYRRISYLGDERYNYADYNEMWDESILMSQTVDLTKFVPTLKYYKFEGWYNFNVVRSERLYNYTDFDFSKGEKLESLTGKYIYDFLNGDEYISYDDDYYGFYLVAHFVPVDYRLVVDYRDLENDGVVAKEITFNIENYRSLDLPVLTNTPTGYAFEGYGLQRDMGDVEGKAGCYTNEYVVSEHVAYYRNGSFKFSEDTISLIDQLPEDLTAPIQPVVIYANFLAIKYTLTQIRYDVDEYDYQTSPLRTCTFNVEEEVELYKSGDEKYFGVKWYTEKNGEGVEYTKIEKGTHQNITLYSKCTPKSCTANVIYQTVTQINETEYRCVNQETKTYTGFTTEPKETHIPFDYKVPENYVENKKIYGGLSLGQRGDIADYEKFATEVGEDVLFPRKKLHYYSHNDTLVADIYIMIECDYLLTFNVKETGAEYYYESEENDPYCGQRLTLQEKGISIEYADDAHKLIKSFTYRVNGATFAKNKDADGKIKKVYLPLFKKDGYYIQDIYSKGGDYSNNNTIDIIGWGQYIHEENQYAKYEKAYINNYESPAQYTWNWYGFATYHNYLHLDETGENLVYDDFKICMSRFAESNGMFKVINMNSQYAFDKYIKNGENNFQWDDYNQFIYKDKYFTSSMLLVGDKYDSTANDQILVDITEPADFYFRQRVEFRFEFISEDSTEEKESYYIAKKYIYLDTIKNKDEFVFDTADYSLEKIRDTADVCDIEISKLCGKYDIVEWNNYFNGESSPITVPLEYNVYSFILSHTSYKSDGTNVFSVKIGIAPRIDFVRVIDGVETTIHTVNITGFDTRWNYTTKFEDLPANYASQTLLSSYNVAIKQKFTSGTFGGKYYASYNSQTQTYSDAITSLTGLARYQKIYVV